MYERTTSTRFASVNVCQSFSGSAEEFADNGLAHALSLWSSSSSNQLPVSKYHYILAGSAQARAQHAETELQVLHAETIETLWKASYTISSRVDVKAESSEDDQLH